MEGVIVATVCVGFILMLKVFIIVENYEVIMDTYGKTIFDLILCVPTLLYTSFGIGITWGIVQ